MMSSDESRRRDVLKAGALGAAAGLLVGAPQRSSAEYGRSGATSYAISPTNFAIVDERVRRGLDIAVGGRPGMFGNGIVLKPKDLDTDYQKYIQIGLTLPLGRINSLSLNYSCEGESFITQINLIEVAAAGETRFIWHTQEKQAGTGRFSPAINRDFEGSLDLTVGVVFRDMAEKIRIGALTVFIG
jgi:hypothetical protein